MATLSMKFLTGLGLTTEQAELVGERHKEVLNEIITERDKFKEDAEKLPNVEAELKNLKAKAEGEDPYKDKFEKLEKEYNDYKADIEAKATANRQEKALRGVLKEIGIPEKRIDSVIKVTDFSKIEFDKEGQIKGGDELKDNLKTEWADFIATKKTEGVNSATPPANSAGKNTMTKEQIRAITDTAERQKAMIENASLFPSLGISQTN